MFLCVHADGLIHFKHMTPIRVDHFLGDVDVYKMVLEPDIPMETYCIDGGLFSPTRS
jgi:hypothetical protein